MKQYLKDLAVALWKPILVSIFAIIGTIVGMHKHWYGFMSICAIVLSFVMCLWGPWVEENFKSTHCETKSQALIFGQLEFAIYSWQLVASGSWAVYLICRLPMLIMHSASSLCYYHYNNKTMRWFWFLNHAAWNIVASVRPMWLLSFNGKSVIPTTLTIVVTLFWATSLCFKLFRKKQSVIC